MTPTDALPDFTWLPDLALRPLGGAVIWANDETFAEKDNLISPGPAGYRPATFGHRGQIYDGWETRRRREPGHDEAIVRLGVPGVIRGVVVDTAPPEFSLEAIEVDGYPRAELLPDTRRRFLVDADNVVQQARLDIYPDGGLARLRLFGDLA